MRSPKQSMLRWRLGTSCYVPRLSAAVALCLATAVATRAQTAPVAQPGPLALSKYDKNNNGRLDPDELAVMQADEAKAKNAPVAAGSDSAAKDSETIQLSPFEVTAENDNGYYASNTMSGTRMASKIEDLAASITVVTRQQLLDTASLDINDIFLYEASTEGTGQYTDATVESQGRVIDNTQERPNESNRVRGIGAANISTDGFSSTSRIPINTFNLESVEISRGPNSMLFGLGDPSGTVNLNQSTGNLNRESTSFSFRGDDWGGFRGSVDLNRPIVKNKLAVRVSGVYESKGFARKPATDIQRRQFLAFNYRPFRGTNVKGSFENYYQYRQTPNSVTPRDMVTEWLLNRQPTWDPLTQTVHYNDGTSSAPGLADGALPLGLGLDTTQYSRPSMYIDNGEVVLWGPNRNSTNGVPSNTGSAQRIIGTYSTYIRNRNALFPLFTVPGVSNRAFYDWEKINFAATNWNEDKAILYNFSIEQRVFETRMQRLYGQAAWRVEDSDNYNRNLVRETSFLYIDPNEKLLDGRPNPFLRRPYVTVWEPTIQNRPEYNDNFRTQVAYQLDLTKQENRWLKWGGRHSLVGYYETRRVTNGTYDYREAILDDHTWINVANRASGSATGRVSYKYYLGDNQGYNVEYAPPKSGNTQGRHLFHYLSNPATGAFTDELALFGQAASRVAHTRTEVHTRGAGLQSFFFNDRLVLIGGVRQDEQRNRNTSNAPVNPATGFIDESNQNIWNAWQYRAGRTRSYGWVARPFRDISFLRNAAESSSPLGKIADFFRGTQFHYNRSDSFRPANPAVNLFGQSLPSPNGQNKDYGFSFSALDGKLVGRVNWYRTITKDARVSGGASTVVGRIQALETGSTSFNLEDWAYNVVTQRPSMANASAETIRAEVAKLSQLPLGFVEQLNPPAGVSVTDVNDVTAKGIEIELNYNPLRNLSFKLTAAKTQTIDSNLSNTTQEFINYRMPAWTTIKDDNGVSWWDTSGARNWYEGQVQTALRLARANVGKPRSQIKEWTWSGIARYNFIEGRFKGLGVGGAIRWADKSAIGFLGAAPDADGVIRSLDPTKPIYDPARASYDFNVSYDLRFFSNKVRARVQLNARDFFAHKGLRAIGVNPDGQPNNFRILDGRQFILTTSFDL